MLQSPPPITSSATYYFNKLQIAKLLIGHGADVNTTNGYGESPLNIACQWGWLRIVQLLCSSDSIDLHSAHNLHRANPFHDACSYGHLEIVKFLAPVVDIEQENKFGSTALLLACLEEHPRIVAFLMQQKVRVDTQSTVGMSPMHAACNWGSAEITRLLLTVQPNLAHIAYPLNGDTPLHIACRKGHFEVIECLLTGGANPQSLNKSRMTPMHMLQLNQHASNAPALVLGKL